MVNHFRTTIGHHAIAWEGSHAIKVSETQIFRIF